MPVIKHYDGICHVYVDKDADLDMARRIVIDAKTQKPGVCNAIETLLVHRDVAAEVPARAPASALQERGVELRGDGDRARRPRRSAWSPPPKKTGRPNTSTSSSRSRPSMIARRGDRPHQPLRLAPHRRDRHHRPRRPPSGSCARSIPPAVYRNASTRFTDGEEFGFGAEIGISTDKLHARGPMGLRELTSYKYKLFGTGQVKDPSAFEG